MNNILIELKKRSAALGLCGEYTDKWESCKTREDLIDVATDINGVNFIADACTFGWAGGFNARYIADTFREYINGRYTRDKDGYTSQLYCSHSGMIKAESTVLCIIDSRCTVYVPREQYCTIVVGGKSSVMIVSPGRINELRIYGDATVYGGSRADTRTEIKESEWTRR